MNRIYFCMQLLSPVLFIQLLILPEQLNTYVASDLEFNVQCSTLMYMYLKRGHIKLEAFEHQLIYILITD